MYNFEKLGRKSVIREVEKYHWIILLKKTNVHTKTLNEIIRSASQHPTLRTAQHSLCICMIFSYFKFTLLKISKASNLKFPRNDTSIWQCQSVLTIICVIFICCYVWSEYHVLFRVQCCPARSPSSHASIKQPSAKWTTLYRHNSEMMNRIFTGEAFCGNPSAPASEAGGDRSSRRGLLDFPRILGSFWSLDYFDIHIHHTNQLPAILSAMESTRNGHIQNLYPNNFTTSLHINSKTDRGEN